jgi:hypothetical protein
MIYLFAKPFSRSHHRTQLASISAFTVFKKNWCYDNRFCWRHKLVDETCYVAVGSRVASAGAVNVAQLSKTANLIDLPSVITTGPTNGTTNELPNRHNQSVNQSSVLRFFFFVPAPRPILAWNARFFSSLPI